MKPTFINATIKRLGRFSRPLRYLAKIVMLAISMAAHNSGGVIVQVKRIAGRWALNPRQVKISGILVDYVVVAEKPEYHLQTFLEQYNPAFSSKVKKPN
jgi:propionate CoA-transferase